VEGGDEEEGRKRQGTHKRMAAAASWGVPGRASGMSGYACGSGAADGGGGGRAPGMPRAMFTPSTWSDTPCSFAAVRLHARAPACVSARMLEGAAAGMRTAW